jgi:hypothetical protein
MLSALHALAGECKIEVDTIDYQPQYKILQANGKQQIIKIHEYSSLGSFLGIYTIHDPMKYLQQEQGCQILLLDKMSAVKSLKESKSEIDWVLRNSGKNAKSSEWLDDFDSTFDAYCTFYPEISAATRKSILRYIGDQTSSSHKFNECYICFYKHNNLRGEGGIGNISFADMRSRINGREIITTAHGIILKRKSKYKWLYLTDHVFKLRWPTMEVANTRNDSITSNANSNKTSTPRPKVLNEIDSIKAFRN